MNLPLVSVIIPAYNAEQFIARTLSSVIEQTYENIEIIVVDDGSKDRTVEIVKQIATKDSRITLLRQPNSGVAKARNLAIDNAKGEYIAPIDADDLWHPQKIEKQVEVFLNSEASVGLVYAWSVLIDASDRITNRVDNINSFHFSNVARAEGKVYLPLIYFNFIANGSVPLIRKSCLNNVGNYNELLREKGALNCEDWDMQLRIAEFYQYKVVPKFLVGYRRLPSSKSGNYLGVAKSYNIMIASIQEKYPKIPEFVYRWSKSYFYSSLFTKSYKNQQHRATIRLLAETVKTDYKILIKPGVYKIFFSTLIKYILPKKAKTKPYISKNKSIVLNKIDLSYTEKLETAINNSSDKFKSPYKYLLEKRWHKVLKLNQLEHIWRSQPLESKIKI